MKMASPFDLFNPYAGKLGYDKGTAHDGDVFVYDAARDEAMTTTVNLANVLSFSEAPEGADNQLVLWNVSTGHAHTTPGDFTKFVKFDTIPSGFDGQLLVYNPSDHVAATSGYDINNVLAFETVPETGAPDQLVTFNLDSQYCSAIPNINPSNLLAFSTLPSSGDNLPVVWNHSSGSAATLSFDFNKFLRFDTVPVTGADGRIVVFNRSSGTCGVGDLPDLSLVLEWDGVQAEGDHVLVAYNHTSNKCIGTGIPFYNVLKFATDPGGGANQFVAYNGLTGYCDTAGEADFLRFDSPPDGFDRQCVRYNPSSGKCTAHPIPLRKFVRCELQINDIPYSLFYYLQQPVAHSWYIPYTTWYFSDQPYSNEGYLPNQSGKYFFVEPSIYPKGSPPFFSTPAGVKVLNYGYYRISGYMTFNPNVNFTNWGTLVGIFIGNSAPTWVKVLNSGAGGGTYNCIAVFTTPNNTYNSGDHVVHFEATVLLNANQYIFPAAYNPDDAGPQEGFLGGKRAGDINSLFFPDVVSPEQLHYGSRDPFEVPSSPYNNIVTSWTVEWLNAND